MIAHHRHQMLAVCEEGDGEARQDGCWPGRDSRGGCAAIGAAWTVTVPWNGVQGRGRRADGQEVGVVDEASAPPRPPSNSAAVSRSRGPGAGGAGGNSRPAAGSPPDGGR